MRERLLLALTHNYNNLNHMSSVFNDESLHIGIDDTDSPFGKCTTHLAFKITEYVLERTSANFIDYPLLIRLNPNIPWKTRGNGAVCLRIKSDPQDQQRITEFVKNHVESNSATGSGANPGVVFFRGRQLPDALVEFSKRAMFDVISKQNAIKLAEKLGVEYFTLGNGRGLVGALAAIGCLLDGDHTFEAIAYRRPENCGTERMISVNKVIELSKKTFPYTFNNYDFVNRRVLIAPHGVDPVFCGIRGENADIVASSLRSLEIQEKAEGCMVYRSNQGTNMHLQNELKLSEHKLSEPKSFASGYIRCKVSVDPLIVQGGHAFFAVENDHGQSFPAAVYEPTGLTNVASMLVQGDTIELGGGVRKSSSKHSKILNVEYLLILELVNVVGIHNPLCKTCSKRMKSEGQGKGFQCKHCKSREPPTVLKEIVNIPRKILSGLYIPTPKAHRHLTKPLHRYGLEKKYLARNCKSLPTVLFRY